jgi:sortase (surface protein transpeptidase)
MSDGSTREFEVIETTRVPKEDLDVDAVFQNSGPARVTLITCGGAFNQTERTYLDNVVSSLAPIRAGA